MSANIEETIARFKKLRLRSKGLFEEELPVSDLEAARKLESNLKSAVMGIFSTFFAYGMTQVGEPSNYWYITFFGVVMVASLFSFIRNLNIASRIRALLGNQSRKSVRELLSAGFGGHESMVREKDFHRLLESGDMEFDRMRTNPMLRDYSDYRLAVTVQARYEFALFILLLTAIWAFSRNPLSLFEFYWITILGILTGIYLWRRVQAMEKIRQLMEMHGPQDLPVRFKQDWTTTSA